MTSYSGTCTYLNCPDEMTSMSTTTPVNGVYGNNPYTSNIDAQNASYDRQRDTEMLDLTGVVHDPPRRKHFDWCILSVLGYMCCAPIGLCAMYYAMRSNHGHDHNIEEYKIRNSSTKAKVLTILSIILGSLAVLAMIIAIVVIMNQAEDLTERFNSYNGYNG